MRRAIVNVLIVVPSLAAGFLLGARFAGTKIDRNRNAGVVESGTVSASEGAPADKHGTAAHDGKEFYVITEWAGLGENVLRLPITGDDTVVNALAEVNVLTQFSSPRVCVVRPAAGAFRHARILPVAWEAIVKGGSTATNYQLMAGDRVFITEDNIVALNRFVIERLFGPATAVHTTQTMGRDYNRNRNSF